MADITGRLCIPLLTIGEAVQSLGSVLVDRGHDEDDVIDRLISPAHGFDEAMFWEAVLGPAADQLAEALGLTPFPEDNDA
jgi:hypothetical protein